jgi:ectoine hydroxylase-related dioxygenase (phytanoyl-CoA dioxygenase family)
VHRRVSARQTADVPGIPRLTASAPVADVVAAIRDAGCVIVEQAAAPAQLEAIERELAPYLAATPPGGDEFAGRNTRRTGSLVARSATFRELATHKIVIRTLDEILGDHATSYQLHLTQVIDIGPGEPAQLVHRDQWAFDFFSFPPGFEVECHTMWALTEFTDENGATRVIPGSHRWADKLRPSPDETVAAAMPRGAVLLYVGSLYHGGGANDTDEHRRGINVGYTLSWLRQEENQYLACPAEIARTLPDDLVRLMGYQRGAYALGYVGDLQDPLDVLRGARTGGARFSAR